MPDQHSVNFMFSYLSDFPFYVNTGILVWNSVGGLLPEHVASHAHAHPPTVSFHISQNIKAGI
jgi:hypothetical protein